MSSGKCSILGVLATFLWSEAIHMTYSTWLRVGLFLHLSQVLLPNLWSIEWSWLLPDLGELLMVPVVRDWSGMLRRSCRFVDKIFVILSMIVTWWESLPILCKFIVPDILPSWLDPNHSKMCLCTNGNIIQGKWLKTIIYDLVGGYRGQELVKCLLCFECTGDFLVTLHNVQACQS